MPPKGGPGRALPPLVLASASPRRRSLLGQLGVPFEVQPAHADERLPADADLEEGVLELARRKARGAGRAEAWCLGSDTLVVIDQRVLGKPADPKAGSEMLRSLSGREHRVLTSWWLEPPAGSSQAGRGEVAVAHVHFRELSESQIAAYAASEEPRDKAGGYAIQGAARAFVDRLDGEWSAVVGLPLEGVRRALAELGYRPRSGQGHEGRWLAALVAGALLIGGIGAWARHRAPALELLPPAVMDFAEPLGAPPSAVPTTEASLEAPFAELLARLAPRWPQGFPTEIWLQPTASGAAPSDAPVGSRWRRLRSGRWVAPRRAPEAGVPLVLSLPSRADGGPLAPAELERALRELITQRGLPIASLAFAPERDPERHAWPSEGARRAWSAWAANLVRGR